MLCVSIWFFPTKKLAKGKKKHSISSTGRKWRKREAKPSRTGVMTEEVSDGIKEMVGS